MNLEEINKKRLAELQEQYAQQQFQETLQQHAMMQQQVAQIEKAAKLWMTPEALSRFGNIRVAHQEKALQVAVLIAQFVQQGKINKAITDEQLKELLFYLDDKNKQTKITRK